VNYLLRLFDPDGLCLLTLSRSKSTSWAPPRSVNSFSSLPFPASKLTHLSYLDPRPPDMKSRDGASTPICIRDVQIVEHLLPTLPFLPSTPIRPPPVLLQPLKDPSLDLDRTLEEPPPPAYPESEVSQSKWKKVGKVLRLLFCAARESFLALIGARHSELTTNAQSGRRDGTLLNSSLPKVFSFQLSL
jgi:hypothetical protein